MPDEELAAKTEEHASALDAITTVVSVLEEARSTINRALGLLFTTGGDTTRLDRLQARVSQLITRYNRIVFQVQAAQTVVRPPTPEEIADANAALQKVREITFKDAIRDAGFQALSDMVDRAQQVADQIDVQA